MEIMKLVETGFQISAHTEGSCTEMGMRILPLRNLIGMCCMLKGWEHFDTVQGICGG